MRPVLRLRDLALFVPLLLGAFPAAAATIAVTTTADGVMTDGNCSLREAVQAANTNLAVDACSAGSDTATDEITVPAGPTRSPALPTRTSTRAATSTCSPIPPRSI